MKKLILMNVIILAMPALAVNYDCKIADPNNTPGVFEGHDLRITLKGNRIRLRELEGVTIEDEYTGSIDAKYKPRANSNYVRFQYLDGPMGDGYVNALVEKQMLKGAAEGKVKIQWGGEVFYQDVYTCSLKKK